MISTTSQTPATFADLPALMSLMTGDDKHDQAATSTLDVLWVLYDRVLRVSPETADDDTRDRFLLSKGHGPMAYYAVLAAKGFLDQGELPGFGAFGAKLSLPAVTDALRDIPHRVLGLGMGRPELRRYGTPAEHQAAHGLDARSLRTAISGFLAA